MTYEQFPKDDKTIDSFIRNLEIIGKAAAHIPLKIQELHADLAWLEMRGMRNIMAHGNFGGSLPIIWHTIEHDLIPLDIKFKELLKNKS